MRNRNLALMISVVLFTTRPVFAAEDKTGEFPEVPGSPTVQPTIFGGEKIVLSDSSSLSGSSAEKSLEIPLERKTYPSKQRVFIRVSLGRKNPDSPKANEMEPSLTLMLPNQTPVLLADQGKNPREEKESSSSLQGSQKGLLEGMPSISQEEGRKSPRLGFKRYSLVGPIEYNQVPLPKPFPDEQQTSPGRDGAISPMRRSRDQNF